MRKLSPFVYGLASALVPWLLFLTGCGSGGSMAAPQPVPQTIVVPTFALITNRDDNTLSSYSINSSQASFAATAV